MRDSKRSLGREGRRIVFEPCAAPPLDRAQFPVLERRIGRDGDRALAYLDNAATALVPRRVTDAVTRFLHTSCANIHRGAHVLAEEATDAYECAREHLAAYLGVEDSARVVLTHGATESLNLAALCWAEHALRPGDIVAVAEDNHHSNIVCWLMLAERRGVELAWIPVKADGRLDYGAWCRIAARAPKVVALVQQSNVIGWMQPDLPRILDDARRMGAFIALDGAQAAAHAPVDLATLPVDFYVLSAHKMMGLTGIGALVCSPRALEGMRPAIGGGGMAARVDARGYVPASGPQGFEAGTPAIAAAVAWDEALSMLEEAGMEAVHRHVAALASRAQRGLSDLPGVRVLGGMPSACASLVSFAVEGVHPHDASAAFDAEGVLVRAGHHCAKPIHAALGVRASVRASFAGYSSEADVDALLRAATLLVERTGRAGR